MKTFLQLKIRSLSAENIIHQTENSGSLQRNCSPKLFSLDLTHSYTFFVFPLTVHKYERVTFRLPAHFPKSKLMETEPSNYHACQIRRQPSAHKNTHNPYMLDLFVQLCCHLPKTHSQSCTWRHTETEMWLPIVVTPDDDWVNKTSAVSSTVSCWQNTEQPPPDIELPPKRWLAEAF